MGCGRSFSRLLPHLQYVHRAGAGGELTIGQYSRRSSTLRPVFGASWQTVHRRFTYWSKARVWAKLHRVVLDRLGANGELDWSRCAADPVSIRAVKGGH
jgi:hypothetical protein